MTISQDTQLNHGNDFHLYMGEPSGHEIVAWQRWGNPQLGYKHSCPECGNSNTHFLRLMYWMCHDCGIWFTTSDALYYSGYIGEEEWING